MSAIACPYCRAPIDDASEDLLRCDGCGAQHHPDCYAENGGCTVFGCRCAPAEEPKLSIGATEVEHVGTRVAAPPHTTPSMPPPPPPSCLVPRPEERTVEEIGASIVPSIFASVTTDNTAEVESHEPRSRMGFILLGALLGALGAHNFYAGYKKKALAQLAITVLTLGFGAPMSWIWALIDICTIDRDNYGVNFTS